MTIVAEYDPTLWESSPTARLEMKLSRKTKRAADELVAGLPRSERRAALRDLTQRLLYRSLSANERNLYEALKLAEKVALHGVS